MLSVNKTFGDEGVIVIVSTTTGTGVEGAEHVRGTVAAIPAADAEILEFPAVLQFTSPCPANKATAGALLTHAALDVISAVLPSE